MRKPMPPAIEEKKPSEARPRKLVSLEVARFFAALAVALEHISTTIPDLRLGPASITMPVMVPFFFALSGFVLYNAHYQDAGRPGRLPRYFWRRLWRIYPLYWISLLPMLVILWPGCSAGYLLRIISLYPFTGNIAEMNPPCWTLRFELMFYLIFGLALLPYARRVVLPGWALLLAAAWYHDLRGWGGPTTLLPWLPPGLSGHVLALNNIMIIGGLMAGWLFVRWRPPLRWLWPLLGFSAVSLILLQRLDAWGTLYPADPHLPFTALALAAVIFSLAAVERAGLLRPNRRWAALGAMSYPLFLLHGWAGFILSTLFFFHPEDRTHFAAQPTFFLMLGSALAVSALAAFFLDTPLQRLGRKIL